MGFTLDCSQGQQMAEKKKRNLTFKEVHRYLFDIL